MATETERKFLISSPKWHQSVDKIINIRQGYFETPDNIAIRIRITDEEAFFTVKGSLQEDGMSRAEFEYGIPLIDAEEMLGLCRTPIIEKVRHHVMCEGHLWEVDEFKGENYGLVVAEIELHSPDERFDKPEWLGEEVTDDKRYINACLLDNPYNNWK